jgi:hypothetical protein
LSLLDLRCNFQILIWPASSPCQSFIILLFFHSNMLFKRALFAAPLPLLALGANVHRQLNDSTPQTETTSAPAAVDTPPPTVPFTLISSNPTAFPLSDIVESPSTHPTIALEWTFTAGEQNTDMVSATAPPLPSGKLIFSEFFELACFVSLRGYFWRGPPLGEVMGAPYCRSRKRIPRIAVTCIHARIPSQLAALSSQVIRPWI